MKPCSGLDSIDVIKRQMKKSNSCVTLFHVVIRLKWCYMDQNLPFIDGPVPDVIYHRLKVLSKPQNLVNCIS